MEGSEPSGNGGSVAKPEGAPVVLLSVPGDTSGEDHRVFCMESDSPRGSGVEDNTSAKGYRIPSVRRKAPVGIEDATGQAQLAEDRRLYGSESSRVNEQRNDQRGAKGPRLGPSGRSPGRDALLHQRQPQQGGSDHDQHRQWGMRSLDFGGGYEGETRSRSGLSDQIDQLGFDDQRRYDLLHQQDMEFQQFQRSQEQRYYEMQRSGPQQLIEGTYNNEGSRVMFGAWDQPAFRAASLRATPAQSYRANTMTPQEATAQRFQRAPRQEEDSSRKRSTPTDDNRTEEAFVRPDVAYFKITNNENKLPCTYDAILRACHVSASGDFEASEIEKIKPTMIRATGPFDCVAPIALAAFLIQDGSITIEAKGEYVDFNIVECDANGLTADIRRKRDEMRIRKGEEIRKKVEAKIISKKGDEQKRTFCVYVNLPHQCKEFTDNDDTMTYYADSLARQVKSIQFKDKPAFTQVNTHWVTTQEDRDPGRLQLFCVAAMPVDMLASSGFDFSKLRKLEVKPSPTSEPIIVYPQMDNYLLEKFKINKCCFSACRLRPDGQCPVRSRDVFERNRFQMIGNPLEDIQRVEQERKRQKQLRKQQKKEGCVLDEARRRSERSHLIQCNMQKKGMCPGIDRQGKRVAPCLVWHGYELNYSHDKIDSSTILCCANVTDGLGRHKVCSFTLESCPFLDHPTSQPWQNQPPAPAKAIPSGEPVGEEMDTDLR